jgi:hypothetical protein
VTTFQAWRTSGFEIATFFAPALKLKYGGQAAKAGKAAKAVTKAAEAASLAEKMAETGI